MIARCAVRRAGTGYFEHGDGHWNVVNGEQFAEQL
jgi:hypothetical protein